MAMRFRADNIGSLLRPPDLLEARATYHEGRIDLGQLREIEDRSILQALELQNAAGVDVFTDGEYRRSTFMADFSRTLSKSPMSWISVSSKGLEKTLGCQSS
jgi:5-methyltetrahydropteroyltriglutamate--homocysteine methyltransferase